MRMAEVQRKLKEGNTEFAATNTDYKSLVSGQHPNVAMVSCSDSRVDLAIVLSARLGEIFQPGRPIGEAMDDTTVAGFEYAVAHLGVESMIIAGHTGCGALTEALKLLKEGASPKEAALFRTIKGLSNNISADYDLETAAWENARKQASELLRRSESVSSAVRHGKAELGVLVYDISTGRISDIELVKP